MQQIARGEVKGFQVRIDLRDVKPPIWRRLVLPGDLTLDRLHLALNEAMGWANSHLHQFRTSNQPYAPVFLSDWDLREGAEGTFEGAVRLDQVVAQVGDKLWYDYDFGDGWEHIIKVEKVLDVLPAAVELVTGKRACPLEDSGGLMGYDQIADWVESGRDNSKLPEQFDSVEEALEWIPAEWHPDEFDVEQARLSLAEVLEVPRP